MSLTIQTYPAQTALTGNPIKWKVSTDNRYTVAKQYSYIRFHFLTGAASNGDTLTISFTDENDDTQNVVFTYQDTPVGNTQFSSITDLYRKIQKNLLINKYYKITYQDTLPIQIELTAKFLSSNYDVTITADFSVSSVPQNAQEGELRQFFRVGCKIWAIDYEDGDGLNFIGKIEAEPDDSEQVEFDVSNYLHKYTEGQYALPEADDKLIIERREMTVTYILEFYEKYGIDQTIDNEITTPHYYGICGRVSDELLEKYNDQETDFFSQLAINKQFMTWSPAIKYIFDGQVEKLYFFNYTDDVTQLRLQYTAYYTDGYSVTIPGFYLSNPEQYIVYECICSFAKETLVALYPSKTLQKFDVYVSDQDDNAISEVKTFMFIDNYFELKRQFIFKNQLTGCESLICTGVFSEKDNIERVVLISDDKKLKQRDTNIEKIYSGNTGWLQSREYKQYLREFIASEEIIEIDGNYMYKVIMLTDEQDMWRDYEFTHQIVFEYKRSVIDSIFTPLEIIIEGDWLDYSDTDNFEYDDNGNPIAYK